MRHCPHCGGVVEASFRFCPWCATPQRRKLVEFFTAAPHIRSDRGKALRASAYLDEPMRHLRLSVWLESGEAESAISLDPREATRLASFIEDAMGADLPDEYEETQRLEWLRR
jgi:hypothetical protein